jgi:hypothetical protein
MSTSQVAFYTNRVGKFQKVRFYGQTKVRNPEVTKLTSTSPAYLRRNSSRRTCANAMDDVRTDLHHNEDTVMKHGLLTTRLRTTTVRQRQNIAVAPLASNSLPYRRNSAQQSEYIYDRFIAVHPFIVHPIC